MDCIAHRGFAGVNPENTVPAVRRAVEAGADAVEVDVRRCRSGEPVVVHDATVDRVTGASGPVTGYSLAGLGALDVLDSGAGVPPLDDVFAAAPGEVTLNVELKEAGLAADCVPTFDRHDNDVIVSSFDPAALWPIGDGSDVATALLFADRPSDALDTARELGCRAVHPHHGLCDRSFVDRAHAAGFDVNAWTVRSTDVAERLRTTGVDGLIADAPAYCRSADR